MPRLRRISVVSVLGLLAIAAFASTADAAGLAVDKLVTVNQGTGSRTIVSPAFSTTASNELLLAFVSSDGPTASGAQTFATVTGGGLTWQLRRRANAQYGTSEIWQAVATSPLTAAQVTATRLTGSYQGAMTIVSFIGADTTSAGATAGGERGHRCAQRVARHHPHLARGCGAPAATGTRPWPERSVPIRRR